MHRDELDPRPPDADIEWRKVVPPPASDRDDELLAGLPRGEHHRGRLAGYSAGNRIRFIFLACLAVLFTGTIFAWYHWARRGERPQTAVRQFQLPPGTDVAERPRVLTWSEGKARLGLSREPPGVHTIELPDRTLTLADGVDMAQFKVVVEAGKTTALEVLSGEIVEQLKPGAAPLLAQ
jgi:hypothetical protein